MVRIVGVDLPANKNVVTGLTYIYGIGSSLSKHILQEAGIDSALKIKDLTDPQIIAIRDVIKNCLIEGDLRREINMSIKRLVEIGTYRGSRHRKGLPARGQRTKTNARTKRGKRKTVGLGKRKEEEKT
ncbi:30S ribosomal protein S13 [candidate division WOR-1 bacterium RIFCSPLOWO2_02_FULL_46_20]|uniref:Small ribosomal subunit protein uS13 n=2 Tax=Saganbacteria TaxID=1703751 RepID=A0A1F4R734_UNCSA|nr:MAG: 30S ribosomal protein S13 [candidate division WOR-1 bacterium RIFCSPHIGHO2_02_FULL_45_12]OGC03253.1 MAG: 30S ribosomal protein S13 [candidate division WOR-1 bacterium RIFCSPLOWO2_02_FULL_46_20]OGC08899.1 MAG: 30S ribosomal protein S13 [candidate division WOR-1 bacterium RIFCSPLOWO2_12_FULL_45_9]